MCLCWFSFRFCTHLVTNFALLFLPSCLVRDRRNKALALLSTYNVYKWCALPRCHFYQYSFYRGLLCKGLCSVWTIWRFTCFFIIFPMVFFTDWNVNIHVPNGFGHAPYLFGCRQYLRGNVYSSKVKCSTRTRFLT